ncbi:39S ribosomal protein L36, mitochondrial [Ceratitis capitata]|uniref:39S ribosomal protein L36, mitochondrial n=1 Tax=Ceratitis capitata TaxID=7213 RepID=UPI000329C103|nr:39S ribosomal protein L36, mitochondrial [Ceratitis capitata]
MSFISKIGAHMYKGSLRLLTLAASTVQTSTVSANNRTYHIMANCRTLAASGPIAGNSCTATASAGVDSGLQRLLTPFNSLLTQVAGFKVKGRLKRRCKDCYFVVREERLYVICPTHPRHKQMAMKKRPKNTWILTHATQSKIRPY